MRVLHRLIDDAALLAGSSPPPAHVVADFLVAQTDLPGDWLGSLMVVDHDLTEVARGVPSERVLPVAVVNSTGAGGLLALGRRTWPSLTVAAVESALRDLDDLASNAARVVAAASELDPDVQVFVELPYAPGWLRAVEVVEAAGLWAKVNASAVPTATAIEQLSALVEADLGFKVTGLAVDRVLPLLVAVESLVEGAEPAEAAQLLGSDPRESAATVASWDDATQGRVRRRLVSCDTPDSRATWAQLTILDTLPAGS